MRKFISIFSYLLILLLAAGGAFAQNDPEWTEAFPAFRVAGNLYYVGSKGLASYLVVTPAGNILINSDLEAGESGTDGKFPRALRIESGAIRFPRCRNRTSE
jgi:hypothetical protein